MACDLYFENQVSSEDRRDDLFAPPSVFPFRRKERKFVKRKRNIICRIEQSVVIKMIFTSFYDDKPIRMDSITYKTQSRYVPKCEYAFLLKSIVSGDDCKTLYGQELIDNAINQNIEYYQNNIRNIIRRYQRDNNVNKENYLLDCYEYGIPKIESRIVEYMEEVLSH